MDPPLVALLSEVVGSIFFTMVPGTAAGMILAGSYDPTSGREM